MMLGTNDSCSKNDWTAEKEAGFKAKYIALIDTYAGLESRPKVILATCPKRTDAKAFDDCIRLKMVPLIKTVAEEKGLSVIDIYDATKDFTVTTMSMLSIRMTAAIKSWRRPWPKDSTAFSADYLTRT